MGEDLIFFFHNCRLSNYTDAPKIPTPLVCASRRIPAFQHHSGPCMTWMSVQGWGCRDELPWWLSGKGSNGQCRRLRFNPWFRKILEEKMATHSSILAWRIPRTEEPGRLQFMGLPRVRHDWMTEHIATYSRCEGFLGMMILFTAGLVFPNERKWKGIK